MTANVAGVVDKRRRLGISFLKLTVLVLFTLNLYLFTTNTFKYASSSSSDQLDIESIDRQIDAFEINVAVKKSTSTRTLKMTISKPNVTSHLTYRGPDYNKCNFMKFDDLKPDECDLMISVKTTASNYAIKLDSLLNTWFRQVPSKVIHILNNLNKNENLNSNTF